MNTTQSAQCNDDTYAHMRDFNVDTSWNKTLRRVRLKGKMILKWKLMPYGMMMLCGLVCMRVGSGGGEGACGHDRGQGIT